MPDRFCGATALLGALAVMTMAGCGSAASSSHLAPQAADQLHRDLAGVRVAVGAHQATSAQQALTAFARAVTAQRRTGALTALQAGALRSGIAQARRRIASELPPPAAAVPVPAPAALAPANPAAPPSDTNGQAKDKKNKGNGNGDGGGGGGGGD